jgi:hypothetical protein
VIEKNDGKSLPLIQKAFIGLTVGAIGACVGSPTDLSLIRMQADSTLPIAHGCIVINIDWLIFFVKTLLFFTAKKPLKIIK